MGTELADILMCFWVNALLGDLQLFVEFRILAQID